MQTMSGSREWTPTGQPELVTAARELVAAGTPWEEAAVELRARAGDDRQALSDAALYWVRAFGRRSAYDFEGGATLRALEYAVRTTPRSPAGKT